MRAVVDTNVAIVANGGVEQALPSCVSACAARLLQLTRNGRLVLDDRWLILREYMKHLKSSGERKGGNAFLKWVLTNYRNPDRCELVPLTPKDSSETDFEEFPTDPVLKDFDRSDRKFIAVALAHPERPPILQATDAEWWEVRHAFETAGITIEFLCEEDIKMISERRTAPR